MNKYKMFCVFLVLLYSFNSCSVTYDYDEGIAAQGRKDNIMKTDVILYAGALLLLLDFDNEDVSMYNFTLDDILAMRPQQKLIKKSKIVLKDKVKKTGYDVTLKEMKLDPDDHSNYLSMSKLDESYIKKFLNATLLVQKLHSKKLPKQHPIPRIELNNYFKYSDNYEKKYSFYSYSILQTKVIKSDNISQNLGNVGTMFSALRKECTLEHTIEYVKNYTKGVIISIIKDDEENKEIYQNMLTYISASPDKLLIGPFYNDNDIFLLKIFEKTSLFREEDIDIKVYHYFIKKDSPSKDESENESTSKDKSESVEDIDFDEKSYNTTRLKRVIARSYKMKYDDFLKSYATIEYLNKLTTIKKIYDIVKPLKKNECSNILELDDGWHLFMVIDREYNVNASCYKNLSADVLGRKIAIEKRRYVQDAINGSYLLTFD